MIPLPSEADNERAREFKRGASVLAMFPLTTSFYQAVVVQPVRATPTDRAHLTCSCSGKEKSTYLTLQMMKMMQDRLPQGEPFLLVLLHVTDAKRKERLMRAT